MCVLQTPGRLLYDTSLKKIFQTFICPPLFQFLPSPFFLNQTHLTGKEGVLITEVLTAIRLTEADDTCGIETAGLGCAAGCDTETKGDIGHAVDDDSGVLGAVLGPTADVGLDDYLSKPC